MAKRTGWGASSRQITLNGERVAYRLAGKGPLLLLVHGMAGSSETWRHVLPELAKRYTVLAPDLLGQGESDTPHGDYSLGGQANMLRDLMDALELSRASVVGQSLGGGVSMQFAYQYPERCERLVLVNSGGLGREVTALLRMLTLPGVETVFPLLCQPTIGKWLGFAGARSAAAEEIWRSYASLADPERRRAFFVTLREVIEFGGQAVSALSRLYRAAHLPTLIVWGRADPFLPVSHAIAAHKAIPGSRLEIFDGVGHYPHCETPERFLAVLVDFLEKTQAARLPESARRARRSSRA